MYTNRNNIALEIQLREYIQKAIENTAKKYAEDFKIQRENDHAQLRDLIKNIINEVKDDLILEQFEGEVSEKEMFDLMRKEISGVLKQTIKILKEAQAGDPEQVQIGHLKATILALNNLFDSIEAGGGTLAEEGLREAFDPTSFHVEIGDIDEDVVENPLFMDENTLENDGAEPEDDIAESDSDDIEKMTLDLNDGDIKTLYDSIREKDPDMASYQILGAGRCLDPKTGSWHKVKKIFQNFASRVYEAELPSGAWEVFRKWIVENVRLHLINTIQETASERGGEESRGEDLGGGAEDFDI